MTTLADDDEKIWHPSLGYVSRIEALSWERLREQHRLRQIKARANAMLIGDGAMVRNDDASPGASALGEEQRAPELAADAEEPAIPPEVLAAIEDRIEQLTARLDAFERMQKANAALAELEDEIERLDKAALDALDPLPPKPRVDDAFAEATAMHTPSDRRLN
jgi:hypothetical protein